MERGHDVYDLVYFASPTYSLNQLESELWLYYDPVSPFCATTLYTILSSQWNGLMVALSKIEIETELKLYEVYE